MLNKLCNILKILNFNIKRNLKQIFSNKKSCLKNSSLAILLNFLNSGGIYFLFENFALI